MGRIIAETLRERTGANVIVENRSGASGTLAGTVSTVDVLSPTIGVNTFAEYVEWLKKNPKRHSFGTTAMGSSTHFFGVEIGLAVGIPLEPVAYKGAAPLIADLSAGHAAAGCGGLTDFLTHHRGGKLKIIEISAPKRASAAPGRPGSRGADLDAEGVR